MGVYHTQCRESNLLPTRMGYSGRATSRARLSGFVAIVFHIGFDEDLEFVSLERSTEALSPRLLTLFPRLRRREGLNVQISIKTIISYST